MSLFPEKQSLSTLGFTPGKVIIARNIKADWITLLYMDLSGEETYEDIIRAGNVGSEGR